MELKFLLAMLGLAYVISTNLLLFMLKRRGEMLMLEVERRWPQLYGQLGRPRPGLFHTERRQHFQELMLRPAYDVIPDADVVLRCRHYRRLMLASMTYMVAGLIAVTGMVLWYQRTFPS